MTPTYATILNLTSIQLGIAADKISPELSFIDDLNADSLDAVELVMAFEDAFGLEIGDDEVSRITTLADVERLVETSEQ